MKDYYVSRGMSDAAEVSLWIIVFLVILAVISMAAWFISDSMRRRRRRKVIRAGASTRTVMIPLELYPPVAGEIRAIAKKTGESLSEVVERLCVFALNEMDPDALSDVKRG